ncbi:MAG: hypothetical protein HKP14_01645 [Bacteroidia bacterium]|nr:hypothetical protein [Bacteroidia bacterium]
MKYFRSRFNSAIQILEGYNYPEPFHIHLKNFFRLQKKYGSKDRKAIAEICYTYLRTGRSFKELELQEGLLLSSLLMDFESTEQWQSLSSEFGYSYVLPIDFFKQQSKIKRLKEVYDGNLYFYPKDLIHKHFKNYEDAQNILFRPKNWAKDHTDDEARILGLQGCQEIQPNSNVDETTQIQDLSSQFICSKINIEENDNIWDVCSGAGGKSLNLLSKRKGTFFLSDVRPQIIVNAKSRVQSMLYEASFGSIDLSKAQSFLKFDNAKVGEQYFDTVIADVPCTGSGTWFGTPEHFMNFDYNQLEGFVIKQKQIVENAMPFLKKGGILYYITCSIFSKENQDMKDWIIEKYDLTLGQEFLFNGIEHRADAMYMASFIKS